MSGDGKAFRDYFSREARDVPVLRRLCVILQRSGWNAHELGARVRGQSGFAGRYRQLRQREHWQRGYEVPRLGRVRFGTYLFSLAS
jgi:hypothetical protein